MMDSLAARAVRPGEPAMKRGNWPSPESLERYRVGVPRRPEEDDDAVRAKGTALTHRKRAGRASRPGRSV